MLNLEHHPILFHERVATAEAAASRRGFHCRVRESRTQEPDNNVLWTGCREPSAIAAAMTAQRSIDALPPDLDRFLFATVGEEIDGIPLSVVSALVRLGLDPWAEAARLSVLGRPEAAEQLARLISETPGRSRPLAEAREVARLLVVLLPNRDTVPRIASQLQIRPRYLKLTALPSTYWIVFSVLAGAALFSAIAHHALSFGIGGP